MAEQTLEQAELTIKWHMVPDDDNVIKFTEREETYEMSDAVKQFIKDKNINITEIRNIVIENYDYISIEFFNRGYVLITDEEGKSRAKEYLEDNDDIWQQAVECGNTTEGFDDWVEMILSSEGWEQTLNSYDGCSNYLFGDWYYMRTD